MNKNKLIYGLKWFLNKLIYGLKWFLNSYIWLFVLFLAVDITTKLVVNANVKPEESVVLIPGFLRISLVYNRAAAFGIGTDNDFLNRILYMIIASLGSIGIIAYYVYKFKKLNRFYRATLMLILTGAIGNLIDRSFYKFSGFCVVDWIDFYGIWHWVFNIADSCIVVGAFMLIIYMIVEEVKEAIAKKKLASASNESKQGKILSAEEQRRADKEAAEEADLKEENKE